MSESGESKQPRREDGTFLYTVTTTSWGKSRTRLVAAPSLREAKAAHGWSRNQYETLRVHRATVAEVEATPEWAMPPLSQAADSGSSGPEASC